MPIAVVCRACGAPFSVKPSMVGSGRGRYCSVPCKRLGCQAPRVTRDCTVCGATFTRIKHRADETTGLFCSKPCFEVQRRAALICGICGKSFVVQKYRVARKNLRYCSPACGRIAGKLTRATVVDGTSWIRKKIASGYRTDIESLVECVLIRLGITYLFEQRIGPYFVDFILPDLNIALECDGWFHQIDRVREKDARRDAYITGCGWHVARLHHVDIKRDAERAVRRALAR